MLAASQMVPLSPVGQSPNLADPAVLQMARRIFFRRFSGFVRAADLDLDDAFQAVCVGLVTRSRMGSRWNPERGGLSTWLFVAIQGIVLNLLDQQRRAERRNGSVGRSRDVSEELQFLEEIEADYDGLGPDGAAWVECRLPDIAAESSPNTDAVSHGRGGGGAPRRRRHPVSRCEPK